MAKTTRIEKDRAIGYVRVSTEEQSVHGISLDAQADRLTNYCKVAGLDLVEIVREAAISGAVPLSKRPAGSRLVGMRRNGIRHLIALKLDRLFRSTEDALRQSAEWDRAGLVLHLLDLGGAPFSTGTAMGKFFLTLMAGIAELEKNLIRERTRTALNFKRAHLQAYGAVPLGFKRVGDRLEADPAELEIVAKIRGERAAGKSFAKIAAGLNAAGTPTKAARRWHPSTIRYICLNDGLYQDVPAGKPSGMEEVRS